jgi:MFS family permease
LAEARFRAVPALLVLTLCLFTTAFSRGAGESFSVFLLPLSEHFQWDRAAVASVYSIYMVALGIGSLLAGLTFDHYGARFNYMFGCGLLAFSYGLASALDSLWQFYLVLGVCGGIGAAMVGIIPSQSLISRWFDRRLSTALSIAYAGQGLGTLCMVPVAQLLIDDVGWSKTYTMACVLFVIMWLIVAVLPWKTIVTGASDNPRQTPGGKATTGLSLREALRTRAFWGFFGIFSCTAIGIFGISLQTVAYLIEQGFSEVHAALAFGVVGMLTFAGMTLTGLAADYWPKHLVATASYTLSFIGIAAIALLQWSPNWFLLTIFVLTFGLSAGARGPILTTLMAKSFSGKGLASIYGAANLGQGVGAATGAFSAGLLYDITGGYNTGFILCTVFTFFGALLFWVVPEIRGAEG